MKRKFLSLALVSALFAFAITGVVTAQSEGALSEAEVSVTGDTTLTISASGKMASNTCTGIVAGEPGDTCSTGNEDPADYIEVVDYTGVNLTGHTVNVSFDSSTWFYGGSDPNYGNVNVATNASGADVIVYSWFTLNPTYVTRTGATCTPGTKMQSDVSLPLSDLPIREVDQVMVWNKNSCSASWKYFTEFFYGEAGTNGLGQGSYTNSATYTLVDGTT